MNLEALDAALSKLHERGAALLPGWLSRNTAAHLAACDGISGLKPASAQLNGVDQHFSEARTIRCALLSSFTAAFAAAVQTNADRSGRAPSLSEWQPNDWSYQIYEGGEGIGWHRDFERAKLLIAVFNLSGTAVFHTERSSLDWVFGRQWQLEPGDLVLMRGSGFQNVSFYGRPRHKVDGCSPGRTSLTLRMMQT